MKVKVNFKKPTVLLTAEKYSSMLKEMEDMRHDLALYRGWHAEDQGKILDLITKRDQQAALIQELNDQIAASESALKESESKRDHNATLYETATRAAAELADMLVRANEETKAARSETEDTELELMDREFRIDELEKQVEWLRDKIDEWAKIANDQKNTIINYEAVITDFQEQEVSYQNLLSENTELISKNMDLKKAISEASEKAANFCAEAQFEKERADQLEEANKKLYAQVLAQSDAITYLQRQCAADKEDYNTLEGMYDELHMAAQDFMNRIRK